MPISLSVLLVPLLLAGGDPPARPAGADASLSSEVSALARSLVEPVYRKANGYGFSSFSCDVRRAVRPGGTFDCDTVDEKGGSARYTLAVDEDSQATIAVVSFPVSRLTAEERALLEPPCRAFLDAYGRASWKTLYDALHPALREKVTPDEVRAQLERTRDAMGKLRSATVRTAAVRATEDPTVRHSELVWVLDSEKGPGVARFRIELSGEVPRVTAFRIYPEPGSALSDTVLEAALRELVSGLVGESVLRLAAPFSDLETVGDAVLGSATLASGSDMPVRVEQSGRRDDFERNDYKCQVLDAPWLIRRMFASRSQKTVSVECPSRVVPDDGSQVCRARLEGGELYAVTIHRRAGDHRVTAVEPLDR